MKQILFILVLSLISSISFSQSKTNTAISKGAKELQKSLETLAFEFQLPSNITEEKLNSTIKNYEWYFDVKKLGNNTILIKFKENNSAEQCKVVMLRFLKTLRISYIDIDGEIIDLMKFNQEYLKK